MSTARGPEVVEISVEPCHFRQGQAEVRAIKAARERGERDVRCTHSRFLRDVPAKSEEKTP